jgi:glycine dehydrogenase subunit 1
MDKQKQTVHPYIPNSAPMVKAAMMKEIGIETIDELYEDIPAHLRFKGELNIDGPILSESRLKRELGKILAKNTSCE